MGWRCKLALKPVIVLATKDENGWLLSSYFGQFVGLTSPYCHRCSGSENTDFGLYFLLR